MDDTRDARLEAKLDKMAEHMAAIDVTLAVNTEQLRVHIEGVQLAREQNKLLKQDFDTRLAPIQKHVDTVNIVFKVVCFLSGGGLGHLILKLLKVY